VRRAAKWDIFADPILLHILPRRCRNIDALFSARHSCKSAYITLYSPVYMHAYMHTVKTCDAEAVGRSQPKYSEAERDTAGRQGTQNDGRQMYKELTNPKKYNMRTTFAFIQVLLTGLTGVRRLHYRLIKSRLRKLPWNIQGGVFLVDCPTQPSDQSTLIRSIARR
jgi:hypothetical protein